MTTTQQERDPIEVKLEQLATPFAAEQVGKKPVGKPRNKGEDKRHCRTCNGWHEPSLGHVDFVGHAVVTGRLNNIVGPGNWSYAIDRIVDHNGHVLAVIGTMTVLGRTIGQEVGEPGRTSSYGDELKVAISDFIVRAAMRFGIALNLWARQELEDEAPETSSGAEQPAPAPQAGGDSAVTTSKRTRAAAPDDSTPGDVPEWAQAERDAHAKRNGNGKANAAQPAPAPKGAADNSGTDGNGLPADSRTMLKLRRAREQGQLGENFPELNSIDDIRSLSGEHLDAARRALGIEAPEPTDNIAALDAECQRLGISRADGFGHLSRTTGFEDMQGTGPAREGWEQAVQAWPPDKLTAALQVLRDFADSETVAVAS